MRIRGVIGHGKRLGHTLGFPTANIVADAPLPEVAQGGVYAATIAIEGIPGALPCMVNIGRHPTAPEGPPTVEAHIFDFDADVYGCYAVLTTRKHLRPERKFDSLEALIEQLRRDEEEARKELGTAD